MKALAMFASLLPLLVVALPQVQPRRTLISIVKCLFIHVEADSVKAGP
jgi:hypothetical protein